MEIAEMKVREEIANQQLFRVPPPYVVFSFFLFTLGLQSSDTKVYEP